MTYRLTDEARTDIDSLFEYSWTHFGEARAERYYLGLWDSLVLNAEAPLIARERQGFSPPVRIHPHGRHLIVYRVTDGGILIVRVLHQSMDIEGKLQVPAGASHPRRCASCAPRPASSPRTVR